MFVIYLLVQNLESNNTITIKMKSIKLIKNELQNSLINAGIKVGTLKLISLASYITIDLIATIIAMDLTIATMIMFYAFSRTTPKII